MLRGIRRKWKQPVFYSFVNGGTKSYEIKHIITLIIKECQNIGLHVVATICDQGSNNQAAINLLLKETLDKYKRAGSEIYVTFFEVDGEKILPLYDVPHLFKGIRNNLLKYDLNFNIDKARTAKWNDIFMAYKMDPYIGSLRTLKKLTDSHVNPQTINKMKVSKCTQVFSHSTAVAINLFAFSGTVADIFLKWYICNQI